MEAAEYRLTVLIPFNTTQNTGEESRQEVGLHTGHICEHQPDASFAEQGPSMHLEGSAPSWLQQGK